MRGATISDRRAYLRADLVHQLKAPQLEKFLLQLKAAAFRHPSARVLIYAHTSRATMKVENWHASRFVELLAAHPKMQVALVATHREVQLVQQYLEALARLKKANLRSFIDEPRALAWLIPPLPGAKAVKVRRGAKTP